MRILMLASRVPYPLDYGGAIRTFHMLRSLAQHHSVSLLCHINAPNDTNLLQLRQMCPELIHIETAETARFLVKMRRIITDEQIEVLHVDALSLSQFALLEPKSPMVLSEQNAEYVLHERRAQRGYANPGLSRRVRLLEKMACIHSRAVIVCSDVDRVALQAIAPEARFVIVENGVDLDYWHPLKSQFRIHPPTIVFVGSMWYKPNSDAAIYFCREVLPLVRNKLPDVRFDIVGADPPIEVLRLQEECPAVNVTGRVPDVRPFVARSAVCVVPLRVGSGTRLKILQAMAMGRPIVSTTLGCEGLAVEDNKDILIADEPTAMADAIISVVCQPDLAEGLGNAARDLAQRRYSWDNVLLPLRRLYEHGLPALR